MIRTLMAVAVIAAFALPASAANDSIRIAQGGGADGPDMANRQPGAMSPQPGTMESDKMNAGSSERPARSGTGLSTRERFDRLDRNHDGYISRDEAKDAEELQTRFSELDTNNDGKLSREEYDALNRSASGATGKGGGDSSASGANTK